MQERESRSKVYLVQEYLNGKTLEKELEERAERQDHFTEEESRSITRQMVSALKYLHQKKIIHRDIKPGFLPILIASREHHHHSRPEPIESQAHRLRLSGPAGKPEPLLVPQELRHSSLHGARTSSKEELQLGISVFF